MSLPSDMQVPPPKDWQDFERNLRDLLEAEWGPPVEMHGRTGQPQHGVDIYGQPKGEGNHYHGVQCKLYDRQSGAAVTETELLGEIKKATGFKPKLSRFTLATTAPRDAGIQAIVREFNAREEKPFPVQVIFWDDILTLYDKHLDVYERHYPRSAPREPDRLHQLRAPVGDFIGRGAELEQLLAGMGGGATISAAARVGGIAGLGGVGKTELALVAAHRLMDRYPDAQFLVELGGTSDSPLSGAEALSRVIQSIEPSAKLPEDEKTLREIYLSLLHGKKAIILADNAAGPEHVRPLLPPASCLLLVTSQRHFAIEGLRTIRLDCLSEGEAEELLRTICPRIGGEHAAPIARACGRLPLALRAAASYLAVQGNVSPAEYVQSLADERRRLETIGAEGVDIGVEGSLGLSYRQIEARAADAARVFRLLSVFAGSFDAAAEEVVCEDAGHRRLDELLRYSLVEFDAAEGRYRLHELVRLFAARRLEESASDAERLASQERHARRFAEVLREAGDLYLKGGDGVFKGLSLFDRERANIEAGQAWSAGAEGNDAAARLASDYPGAGVYVLSLRFYPRQQIRWLESALSAARRLKDRHAEGAHLGNLGIAYRNLGKVRKAIEFCEQALVIAREIGDRRVEGSTLGNLGAAYFRLGEFRRAIEFHKQALAISREIRDRRGEGADLGNLGAAYKNLGKVRKAIGFYDQALAISREIGDRSGEGADSWNMALAYDDLGERDKALPLAEAALAIYEQIEDPNAEMVRQALVEWRGEK